MIALPVLAVTAAAVVQATSDVDGVDAIPRTMGSARGPDPAAGRIVMQAPDPDTGMYGTTSSGEPPTLADLAGVLGDREVITIAGATPRCRWVTAGSRCCRPRSTCATR